MEDEIKFTYLEMKVKKLELIIEELSSTCGKSGKYGHHDFLQYFRK